MSVKSIYQNDQEILGKIANGDLKAYRYLFDTYFPDLCNFLLIYLRNRAFAEEVALEIFTVLWEKRGQIEIRSSVKAYLFTAAKNRAISIFRRTKQHIFTSLEIEDQAALADSDSQVFLENKELRQIIEEAVAALPEQSRKIYQMAWEENLSHKEIAQQLGLSPKTVENHVGIALRKLRTQLQPHYKHIFMLWITVF
ncbi:RNA polymerase sigma-70 factor [Mangrovibacterium lignilyticum]|uniref:RNA polymerase sigma-70 factor n=1 Tax=Mangrovibacterium lignilyticum TaxID=2668052 RepID=UPI0013CFF90C|nr:RNA polymerase sigma-70 factor [Mangrovibacterium lignilyticum]